MKSPIRSFGGKGTMKKKIFKYFPSKDKYNIFIEPFMGSMVMALNHEHDKCSTIVNDLNKNIYSFFKVLQDDALFVRLKERLNRIVYSEELFRESLKLLSNWGLQEDISIEERAYHFFIVNRMSYSGNCSTFGKNCSIRRGVAKSTSDLWSSIDGLDKIALKLQNFIILNRNGIELIKSYISNPFCLLYLDPPYHHSTRTKCRYPVDMSNEEQECLISLIKNPKCQIILSGYDNELYQRVLVEQNGWTKVDFEVKTVTGSNLPKTKTESLWLKL